MGIEDVTVGELTPYADKVVVVDYDPHWPEMFAQQGELISAALGDTLRQIVHNGSTSVPGLAAKPIIDITIAVTDSADEESYVPALESLGYELRIREPDWHEHRCLRQRIFLGNPVNVNLHVYTEGCPEIARVVGFRDWLRTHPDDRDRYAATKRELAKREWRYMQDYADAKTDIILEIMKKAGVDLPPAD